MYLLGMTELEAFAVELSQEAARTALPYFRGDNAEENKAGPGAFDPVTEADRAAEALADYLREHCRQPRPDPHAEAHLGAVDAALCGAAAALRECAALIDAHPLADAEFAVRRVRAQVEEAAGQVLTHVGRALGATPFCRDSHFARLSADLPVFLRQSHAERDLAALGQLVIGSTWTL